MSVELATDMYYSSTQTQHNQIACILLKRLMIMKYILPNFISYPD